MDDVIKIAICDDDAMVIKRTASMLGDIDAEVFKFTDGNEFLSHIENGETFDIVFLDIEMPEISGFEIAKRVQNLNTSVYIVFITSHEEMVYQTYKFHQFWFVRKSCFFDDLRLALSELLPKIEFELGEKQRIYNLKSENRDIEIDINTVMYIESSKHYIQVVKYNGEAEKIRCRLSDVEQQLKNLYFIRVQNSVVVNLRFVSQINSRCIVLKNGDKFNISRERLELVRYEFQGFVRSKQK